MPRRVKGQAVTRAIRRYFKDEAKRRWFYWQCFCGEQVRYLNHRAMIRASEQHRDMHKDVEVVDESVDRKGSIQ